MVHGFDPMTRATYNFGDKIKNQNQAVWLISSDENFVSNKFPKYKIGVNNIIIEPPEGPEAQPLKEIVAKETAELLERRQRLSVRDLAKKFEKGLNTATRLSNEAKSKEVASLDRQALLKKLRDVLESLRGRVAGQNKDEAEEAISMVETLTLELTQREDQLLQEKAEVKKLATFLKKACEDAKKVVEEERAYARVEIVSAKAAVRRVEQALHEQEQIFRSNTEKQDSPELMRQVQEARRIKMLHHSSRVMDMVREIQTLHTLHAEKSMNVIQLRKELAMSKRHEGNKTCLYQLEGVENLGSCLRIIPQTASAPDISCCSIQWYRIQPEGGRKEPISGATKSLYAPEPFDVGRLLQAEVVLGNERLTLTTTGPVDSAAGLGSYVEALLRKPETEFNVVVIQMNGNDHSSTSIHVFLIGRIRIKLSKGKTTMVDEFYSSSMQLCGARGTGNAAAQGLFWRTKKGLSFLLAFESERERNAAIMLARRFALDYNIVLAGPDDRTLVGT